VLGQDKTNLMRSQQPADAGIATGNALMFSKGLAPPPEVGCITSDFLFTHRTCK
jgi:hypothetical protein